MITFTKTVNSVEVNFNDLEKHYISVESAVMGKLGDTKVLIADLLKGGNSTRSYNISTVEINGRPSDNPVLVAAWLRDNFFTGYDVGAGGGGGGDASAANQLTQIARADTMLIDQASYADKAPSAKVTEEYDEKVIVYSDAANGVIDYVRYNLLSAEVARDTYSYDGFGNIDGIT